MLKVLSNWWDWIEILLELNRAVKSNFTWYKNNLMMLAIRRSSFTPVYYYYFSFDNIYFFKIMCRIIHNLFSKHKYEDNTHFLLICMYVLMHVTVLEKKPRKKMKKDLVDVINEDVCSESWRITKIVHQLASNKQYKRCTKTITNGSDEAKSHQPHIYIIRMHENWPYGSLYLLQFLLLITHFSFSLLRRKQNSTQRISKPLRSVTNCLLLFSLLASKIVLSFKTSEKGNKWQGDAFGLSLKKQTWEMSCIYSYSSSCFVKSRPLKGKIIIKGYIYMGTKIVNRPWMLKQQTVHPFLHNWTKKAHF